MYLWRRRPCVLEWRRILVQVECTSRVEEIECKNLNKRVYSIYENTKKKNTYTAD